MLETPTEQQQTLLREIDHELMQLDHLPELSDHRYHETHDTFEAVSNQRAMILEWLDGWAAASLEVERAEVLSVGCGGGTMDLQIAETLMDHCGSLALAGVDPNPLHTRAFADCFADRVAEVTVATSPFEEYETDHRFDVIHFIHCLYYFEDLEKSLPRALAMLKPSGKMLVLNAPNGLLNQLAHRIWKRQWNRAAWYTEDILRVVRRSERSVQVDRLDAWADVTSSLDESSEHGRLVLDFIVQAETSKLSARLQELLRDYLDAIAKSEDGRRLAPHPVDAIAV